ncbi:cation:proton antiporter [Dyadobacter fanqingshengii]|uniref:Sodium:proton antiporter n=1 Tax=Dyadobacter fanqingshengii TaxID=2906443 RepID=A0A9X1PAD7_9BACT|nr:sodium:proton antiporter [Dyadobacter fanqingshengii]MCF0041306.1 sodium:proton antiporter [Dyadobacter fanqingshengii]MCF2505588.1 sodium:proton antiporter [Dyadobacter fanqingshengii]USJ36971.1 sodium:proton antiporter [Dyadobacter fanqingshengii]
MELYYSFSALIVLSAIFSYINSRFLKLPPSIGVMVIALLVSLGLIATDTIFPRIFLRITTLIGSVDLTEILMGAMLNFLLFAGAIHIHLEDLREQRLPIIVFSTLSVLMSTFIIGFLVYYLLPFTGIQIPLIQCLVFGALISPTDPIAVLGILKQAGVPKSIETKIAGESLFNDGMAVVIFILMLALARGEEVNTTFGGITMLFVKEALGGIALGLALGFVGSKMIYKVDGYNVHVLITLAIVMGGHLAAQALHMSGPLAMVAAGLVVGNYGKNPGAVSDMERDYIDKFWELIDEILNAILFLIIGFELLLIPDLKQFGWAGMIAIVVVLLARFISIYVPVKLIPFKNKFGKKSIAILVWGGLRGGVSIALALSIDKDLNKDIFLAITYFVVLFSIIVQGLTVGKLTKRFPEEAVGE